MAKVNDKKELKTIPEIMLPSSPVTAHLEQFNISQPEKWNSYYQRFKLYLLANEIQGESRQQAVFLTVCGSQLYDLLCSLAAPQEVSTLNLSQIEAILKNHFSPIPSEIAAFYKFFKRDQLPDECFASYVAELRRLAINCNFESSLDRMLRDRIVCGLRDEALQRSFLAEDKLTLKKVIEKASTAEAATKNLHEIRHPDESIHFIGKQKQRNSTPSSSSQCSGCGGSHSRVSCPYHNATCANCGKTGHLQRVCRSKKATSSNKPKNKSHRSKNKSTVNHIHPLTDLKKRVLITINNQECSFEVDSGSSYTIISLSTCETIWPDKKPHFHNCDLQLVDFQQNHIPVVGIIDVDILYNGKFVSDLPVVVVNGNKSSVLGCNWFAPLGISLQGVNMVSEDVLVEDIVSSYKDLFSDELGCYTGPPISLEIDPNVLPVRLPPRRVPLALRSKVEAELSRLEKEGVLVPVEYSDWATPIVPVVKSDGSIRICGDYKSTLNKAVRPHCLQIPPISTLLASIEDGIVFAKLDLNQAYTQLTVDEKSSSYQTIVTQKGAYRVNRLQFGVSSAPGIFQSFIENTLRGIVGVLPYFDDIVVTGHDKKQLAERLNEVFSRFRKLGLRLRLSKCQFGLKSVDFLGFKIDSLGIRPKTDKVKAIKEAAPPKDKKQLQAFLGILNFYHSFLPQKATVAEPLHRLLDKNQKWEWTKLHETSFKDLKDLISSDRILVHYTHKLPLRIVCDASPYGVGIVLCHLCNDGSEKPISFYSRTLTKAERNYSQIDRESVAIIAGIKKFHEFLYGRRFTIITDHRPLLGIFNPNKQTPNVVSAQMLRRRIFLNAYDYDIIHRSGSKMGNADFLSRFPLQNRKEETEEVEEVLMLETLANPVLTPQEIAKMISKDSIYSQVLSWALRGWPEKQPTEEKFRAFFHKRNEISTLKGCLLWGNRTVIPKAGQEAILTALHAGHPGIVRMKALARSYVWWPNIGDDCERTVKMCEACQVSRPEEQPANTNPWEVTEHPWSRLHIDFAGPFQGKIFFLVVDSHSKWLEVHHVSTTSSKCAIQVLRMLFATHGLPDSIVSDNGTAFTSEEFKSFCNNNLIRHIRIAPFHPSSNGQAERMVQTAKNYLKKMPDGTETQLNLSRFLLSQHITPSATTGRSPSDLMYNRQIKTYFDKIHPNAISLNTKTAVSESNTEVVIKKQFHIDDLIWARNYSRGPKWVAGVIKSKTSPLSYNVVLEGGHLVKRHADQLRQRQKYTYEDHPSADQQSQPNCSSNDSTEHPPHELPPAESTESQRSTRVRKEVQYYKKK